MILLYLPYKYEFITLTKSFGIIISNNFVVKSTRLWVYMLFTRGVTKSNLYLSFLCNCEVDGIPAILSILSINSLI